MTDQKPDSESNPEKTSSATDDQTPEAESVSVPTEEFHKTRSNDTVLEMSVVRTDADSAFETLPLPLSSSSDENSNKRDSHESVTDIKQLPSSTKAQDELKKQVMSEEAQGLAEVLDTNDVIDSIADADLGREEGDKRDSSGTNDKKPDANVKKVASVASIPKEGPTKKNRRSSRLSASFAGKLPSLDFLTSAGGKGVYAPPFRGVCQSGRPVSLDLRPHPLRDTEAQRPTHAILCTESSVWAACEIGIQVWDVASATSHWTASGGSKNLKGDEDAAPYRLLATHGSPATCLVMDVATSTMWSGHKDGKLRVWPFHVDADDLSKIGASYELYVWQGHRTAVTAMVITSYGEYYQS